MGITKYCTPLGVNQGLRKLRERAAGIDTGWETSAINLAKGD
jgi:hypothetical protein